MLRDGRGWWDLANGVLGVFGLWALIAIVHDHPWAAGVLGLTLLSLIAYIGTHAPAPRYPRGYFRQLREGIMRERD